MQAADFKLKLVSNTIQSAGASQGSQYTTNRYGPDCEMYVTTTTVDGGVDLIGRLNSPNSTSQTGYWVAFDIPGDAVSIYRLIGTTVKTVLLTTKSGITIVTGDQLGYRLVDERIIAFVNGVEVLRAIDDGFRSAGYLAINQFSNQSPITSVGGGTLATNKRPDYSNLPKRRARPGKVYA
jgi:hypothetical protein